MPRPGPLSIFTYYARNKRKVVPLLLILTLAVALMVVVQSLVSSARDTAYAIFGSYSRVEVVAPRVRSSVDAYKPISEALDALRVDQSTLRAGGVLDGGGGVGSLAQVLLALEQLPAQLKTALPNLPSTAPLQASLGAASADGARLQGDLSRLAADLRAAQQRQAKQAAEQQQLLALLTFEETHPGDTAALVQYLKAPHDFSVLGTPDTTDYAAIAAEADRSGADAALLGTGLETVQQRAAELSATAKSALGSVKPPVVPGLDAALPTLPAASAALKGLGAQLADLEAKLAGINTAQGNIDAIEKAARALPGIDRVERDTYANIDLTMLAGNANFDLYGLSSEGMRYMLNLYGDRVVEGRLPRQDKAEVAISEEVAHARGIWIGGLVGSDVDELDSLPEHFTVVGIIRGPTRLGLLPYDFMVNNYFFSRRYQALLVIPSAAHLVDSRPALHSLVKSQPYRIFDGPFVADKIDSLLVNLQRINDFLTLVVGLTLALVIGLLNNLYFRQRMNEFGLLAALGYPRRRLIRRVALEGAVVVVGAWILGGLVAVGLLEWFNAAYMLPHGLVIKVFDPGILLRATLPVPVMVLLVSQGTLLLQLSRLDPISIIERRD